VHPSAPGVGKEYTDVTIVSNRIKYLSDEELKQLANVYEAKVRLEKPKEVEDMIGKLSFDK
jgi:hypothetical protein